MPVFEFLNAAKKADASKRLENIPVDSIQPNPNQPRRTFDEDALNELAASIRQVGLLQPLLVRRMEGGYELVAGERRLRAVRILGLERVPCVVQNDVFEEDSAMMALIENLQRENLHYLEEAECYNALLAAYSLTQEELAERLGKSQSSIANKLRILKLSPEVKRAVTEGKLSERHARALLRIRDEETQLELVNRVRDKGLSVKDTEKLVNKTLDKLFDSKKDGARPRPIIVRMVKDYRLFMNSMNMAVNQLREAGFTVELEQKDRSDGVDITINITRIGG